MSATPPYTPSDLSGMADYLRDHGWLVAPPQREGEPLPEGRYFQEIDADDWRQHELRDGDHVYGGKRIWGPVSVSRFPVEVDP